MEAIEVVRYTVGGSGGRVNGIVVSEGWKKP